MYVPKGTTIKGMVAISTSNVSPFFPSTFHELLDSTPYNLQTQTNEH
jgi:hypothetical protein